MTKQKWIKLTILVALQILSILGPTSARPQISSKSNTTTTTTGKSASPADATTDSGDDYDGDTEALFSVPAKNNQTQSSQPDSTQINTNATNGKLPTINNQTENLPKEKPKNPPTAQESTDAPQLVAKNAPKQNAAAPSEPADENAPEPEPEKVSPEPEPEKSEASPEAEPESEPEPENSPEPESEPEPKHHEGSENAAIEVKNAHVKSMQTDGAGDHEHDHNEHPLPHPVIAAKGPAKPRAPPIVANSDSGAVSISGQNIMLLLLLSAISFMSTLF